MAKITQYAPHKPSSVSGRRQYLVLYNIISLLLWTSLLVRILGTIVLTALLPSSDLTAGLFRVYRSNGNFAKWVQTLALAEVVHSLVGIVRAPVMTTGMQVASRLLLVWGVVGLFGEHRLLEEPFSAVHSVQTVAGQGDVESGNHIAYLGMLLAWAMTECVRYMYFVFFLSADGDTKAIPAWLSWLRYNTFFILYPLGISCECWLIYKSLFIARSWDWRYQWFLMGVLLIYIPGSYILFTHMMAQRRRVMRGKQKVMTR